MSSNGITASREVVSAPAAAGTVTVIGAETYSGNSIVEAFAKIASVQSGDITITLAPGTYEVPFGKGLNYKGGANIKIQGAGTAKYGLDVLIKGRGKDQKTDTTRAVLEVEGTGNLVLENVTIRNTTRRSEVTETSSSGSPLTQAEALGFDSSGTVAAYNCSFLSHQDTVHTISKSWFYNCYIEGDVDFIWMRQGSIVGLYEQCKIYMVGDDEKSECYVLAPRINLASKVGKGNVIYKSRIIVGDGVNKAYLFRNPWNKPEDEGTLYNQGAVVDTEISGTLDSGLAKYAALGEVGHDPKHLGWKVDSAIAGAYPSRLSSIGTVDATTKASEYGGREAILNRMYNLDASAYERDAVTYWNIASVITENGWSATKDTSSSKLASDAEEKSTQTYNFKAMGSTQTSYADAEGNGVPAQLSGWGYHGATYGISSKTDNSIVIPVVAACTVKVNLSYVGDGGGTITVECTDNTNQTFSNRPQSDLSDVATFTYSGSSEKKLTIKATGNNNSGAATVYISSIEVAYNGDVSAKLKELGKKYAANTTYDFTKLAASSVQTTVSATTGAGGALTLTNFTTTDQLKFGIKSTAAATIAIPVSDNCTINVYVSYANNSGALTCTNATTSNSYTQGDHNQSPERQSFAYTGGSGTATVSTTEGNVYISSISVIYVE